MMKAIEFVRDGFVLRGTEHLPNQISSSIPAIILFHGFTAIRCEFVFSFVRLAKRLETAGIAVYRFDFMGSGESDGDFSDMSVSTELEDAHAILNYVRSLEYIDSKRIGVLGMSMGGCVASLLAGLRPHDIQSLCLWAPAGFIPDMARNGFLLGKQITEEIKESGYLPWGTLQVGMKFFTQDINLHVYETAQKFEGSVLLVHGDKDLTVPIETSYEYLKYYNNRAQLITITGASHGFETLNYLALLFESTESFFKSQLL